MAFATYAPTFFGYMISVLAIVSGVWLHSIPSLLLWIQNSNPSAWLAWHWLTPFHPITGALSTSTGKGFFHTSSVWPHQLAKQSHRTGNRVRPLTMKPHTGSELLPSRLASMALVDTLPSNYWCTEHHYSQRIITNCQPQRRIYFCVPVLVPTFLIGIPHKAGVTKMFYLSFGYYCTVASL